MTTGQILDFSSGQVNKNVSLSNQTSYQYKRVAASGIVDTIQLNVNDNTSSDMDFQTQLDCLTEMKDSATEPSVYINKSRMMSSISNETLPLDHSFQHNHNVTTNTEMTQFWNDELVSHNGCIDVTDQQKKMSQRYSRLTFTHSDTACMDLFHIMKTSNVPLVMFDRIIRWLKRHEGNIASHGTSGFLNRKNFIESMNKKLYLDSASIMKPKLCPTQLTSGRTSNVVIFSMKEMILRMVTNKSIFHPGNLLLDPTNPCAEPPDDGYYGDVNSGKWYMNEKK